jgi:predicted TIM-barrel fold metal-dependent hydrolase
LKPLSPLSCVLIAVLLAASIACARAEVPPVIDTHFHIAPGSDLSSGVDAAIQAMDAHGVQRIVLMSQPRPSRARFVYDAPDLRFAAQKYPGRIFLAAGGGTLNAMILDTAPDAVTEDLKQRFKARAEQLAADAVAFGEIAAHHLSLRNMGPQHAYEAAPPDHPLLLVLADVAARHGMPIDLHLDLVPQDMELPQRPVFNPANPARLAGNLEAFERLLAHNSAAKIVWAHAGTDPLATRTPAVQRELLARHPNLYMSLRLARGGPAPVFALDETLKLKPAWLALLRDFPDRFVLGSDLMQTAAGVQNGPDAGSLRHFRLFLEQLPPPLAEGISHRNAERIYPLAVRR